MNNLEEKIKELEERVDFLERNAIGFHNGKPWKLSLFPKILNTEDVVG